MTDYKIYKPQWDVEFIKADSIGNMHYTPLELHVGLWSNIVGHMVTSGCYWPDLYISAPFLP